MKAGSKELIDEAKVFFGLFNHELSDSEMRNLLYKQGIGEKLSPDIARNSDQWKVVNRYRWLFRCLPFLRMVAVCNALAMGTADENSDLDLFVIVRSGRIFTARVIMTSLFHILGVRRHGNKIKNRFCLSFFITDDALSLKSIVKRRDVYLKYWILTLKPVTGVDFFANFNRANGVNLEPAQNVKKRCLVSSLSEWFLKGVLGDFIEKKLKRIHEKRWQRLRKHIGSNHGIVVSDEMLKFHNIDMRDYYRDEFEKRGGKYIDSILFS